MPMEMNQIRFTENEQPESSNLMHDKINQNERNREATEVNYKQRFSLNVRRQVIEYYRDDQRKFWRMYSTMAIVFVQIIIYVFDQQIDNKLTKILEFQPKNKREAWRYLSYSFIHSNWLHLVGNCTFQLLAGALLEPLYSALRVSGVFAIGVVSGSLVQAVFNHAYALLGSSAGVYALMVSLVPNVFLNWQEQLHEGSSIPAHLAGVFSGVVFGLLIFENYQVEAYEKCIIIIAWILSILFLLIFIGLNVLDRYT
ncbi:rhomboid-related protein 2-like isoform X2 [Atheta coriaria]|uniref:rhomboid-related protein 2-like isoform X2 n=1 Tax=Dalotia coriaria TaxID=877792 RepID=UPI0031F3E13C